MKSLDNYMCAMKFHAYITARDFILSLLLSLSPCEMEMMNNISEIFQLQTQNVPQLMNQMLRKMS
jgi:hypothetical protein